MQNLILIFIASFPMFSFANNADLGGRTAKYFYFELVPNQKLVLNIEASRRCAQETQENLTIKDFEGIKSYPSTESVKSVPVRIKHYYIESFSPCSTPVQGKISKQVTVGPFKDKMTHIRITTSDNVKIETL